MDMEGASAVLGPLTFPEPQKPISHFSFAPWETTNCTCVLCNLQFELPNEKDFLLAHLYSVHKLVIADVHLISSLKGYLDYWKVRFGQQPITDFCTTMALEDENYYLLSEVHPEDAELRRGLANKRLEWVLECQAKERQDMSFERRCLFCRHFEKGSRADYLTHLSYQHNLQLGRPDNLVFVDRLLDKVEEKLNKLECLYCYHTFKDKNVLKEHMRKKFHKRINPKNKDFDPFYVINYLEGGQQQEREECETEDSWSQWREEGSDWSDWQEEPSPIVCLFCTFTCGEWEDVLQHMCSAHRFSYKTMIADFNFYEQVKIVNYIRRQVYLCRCYECKATFASSDMLLDHMNVSNHFTVPNRKDWDHPEFFFPTYENDTFLCLLEDNEDPMEKLSTQMLSDCVVKDGSSISGT